MRLLDTDILVDVLRGHPPAVGWLASLDAAEVVVPGFVVLELIQGCRNRREVLRLFQVVSRLPIRWARPADGDLAIQLSAQYFLSHNLDAFDALIAATAIGSDATLCTFNLRHFRHVQGLRTEQPYVK